MIATVPTGHFLILSAAVFSIGALGVMLRKNLLTVLMSVELMLNAVNIALAAFSRHHVLSGQEGHVTGQVFVLMVVAAAAAEAAVALAMVLAVFRQRETVDSDRLDLLKF